VPTPKSKRRKRRKRKNQPIPRKPSQMQKKQRKKRRKKPAPAIRADCEQNECSEPAKHFKHCSEKIEAGKGWHGEDCVEELFHMMHCVDVSRHFLPFIRLY
jgi:hypothetical protein